MSSLGHLIDLFAKFPSLGPRSARRIVLYLLKNKEKLIPHLDNGAKKVIVVRPHPLGYKFDGLNYLGLLAGYWWQNNPDSRNLEKATP